MCVKNAQVKLESVILLARKSYRNHGITSDRCLWYTTWKRIIWNKYLHKAVYSRKKTDI